MAWSSSGVAAAVAVAVTLSTGARLAVAEPRCDGAATLSLMTVRYTIDPAPRAHLGLDLRVRGLQVGWGGGCDVRRHALELSDAESPELGQPARTVVRLATYRRGWEGRGWSAHLGLRGAVRWGESWRFATPLVGGSLVAGRTLLRAELELGGLSLVRPDARIARRRTDLALDASATWPDHARTRGEVRVRVRDLALPGGDDVHDVTVTAGIGLALAAPERLRALPAFVGLAARSADQRTALVVLEWSLGVTTP